MAAALQAHGVRVAWTTPEQPVHMKAAVVDRTAYLDDRNWPADSRHLKHGHLKKAKKALRGAC